MTDDFETALRKFGRPVDLCDLIETHSPNDWRPSPSTISRWKKDGNPWVTALLNRINELEGK